MEPEFTLRKPPTARTPKESRATAERFVEFLDANAGLWGVMGEYPTRYSAQGRTYKLNQHYKGLGYEFVSRRENGKNIIYGIKHESPLAFRLPI